MCTAAYYCMYLTPYAPECKIKLYEYLCIHGRFPGIKDVKGRPAIQIGLHVKVKSAGSEYKLHHLSSEGTHEIQQ